MTRIYRTLALLSMLINVVLLGGRPGEMTSTKVYRLARRGNRFAGIAEVALGWLFWDRDHCARCLAKDRVRAGQLLSELESV